MAAMTLSFAAHRAAADVRRLAEDFAASKLAYLEFMIELFEPSGDSQGSPSNGRVTAYAEAGHALLEALKAMGRQSVRIGDMVFLADPAYARLDLVVAEEIAG